MAVLKLPTCKHGCTDECLACYDEQLAQLRAIAERASRLEALYYNTHLNPEGFRLTIEGIARDARAALAVPNAGIKAAPKASGLE